MKVIIGWILLLFVLGANGQSDNIFKVTSKDGEIIYTDKPLGNSKQIELPNGSTITSTLMTNSSNDSLNQTIKQSPKTRYQLTVISPRPEQTIHNNNGDLTIQAAVTPKVQGIYSLHLNDRVISQNSETFQLTALDRGVYNFYIEFALKSGKILASTPTQTFYLHQASALNRPK